MRRGPWNPYFSKASVSRLQPLLIQSCVDKFCTRIAEHQAAGKPVGMTHAFACLTADVISEYSFPSGYNLLDRPEFDRDHYEAWMALTKMSHLFKQFGWLYPTLDRLPLWLTKITSPEAYSVLQLAHVLLEQTLAIMKKRENPDFKEITERPSLLEAFLASDLPESQKTPHRIKGEGLIAIGAGTLTSSHCLKHATYHILANPPIFERLMSDLEEAIPDPDSPPNLAQLEQIHYLVAVMYESLRGFYGVSHRLQRIFPNDALQYKQWTIPPGTPISMTSVHIHDNPDIFPSPYEFRPERWLPLNTEGQRLMKYLASFGKGSRQCVGMELGKAEILTCLACLFRRFGRQMRLFDTIRERDVDCVYDVFNPLSSKDGNGVLVTFDKAD